MHVLFDLDSIIQSLIFGVKPLLQSRVRQEVEDINVLHKMGRRGGGGGGGIYTDWQPRQWKPVAQCVSISWKMINFWMPVVSTCPQI